MEKIRGLTYNYYSLERWCELFNILQKFTVVQVITNCNIMDFRVLIFVTF